MDDYRQIIHGAEPGQIIPIVKRIDLDDPLAFFAKLTDYGRAKNCCLLESREYLAGTGALSFGTARPALYLTGTGSDFTIKALTKTGRRMLSYLADEERFAFCESVEFGADAITGTIKKTEGTVDEQTRLRSTNQMDVLRAVAFSFRLASKPFRVTCGLLGALSYDFVDQFEKLPSNDQDVLGNPDYELYFADNIFLMDHEHNQGYVVVNCMITDGDREEAVEEAQNAFDYYFNMARFNPPKGRRHDEGLPAASTDTVQSEYERMVETLRLQSELGGDGAAETDSTIVDYLSLCVSVASGETLSSIVERAPRLARFVNASGRIMDDRTAAYWRQQLTLNLPEVYGAIEEPVLIVYAGSDFLTQLACHERIRDVLEGAGNGDVTLAVFDDLDHAYALAADKAASFEHYPTRAFVPNPAPVERIKGWLSERSGNLRRIP